MSNESIQLLVNVAFSRFQRMNFNASGMTDIECFYPRIRAGCWSTTP